MFKEIGENEGQLTAIYVGLCIDLLKYIVANLTPTLQRSDLLVTISDAEA